MFLKTTFLQKNNNKIKALTLFKVFFSLPVWLFFSASNNVEASTFNIPEPFRGYDVSSEIVINYDDYSALLQTSVYVVGRSTRAKAPRQLPKIGTRLRTKQNINTGLEGNRFHFKNFKSDENKALLVEIRKSLEKVPSEVSMNLLNLDEQLAYWLNLYNITLLEQLIEIYPKSNLSSTLYDDDGILNRKLLNVAGVKLSLNDIQYNIILAKFGYDPLVMYGLYQGVIGGPNIRREAYTGKTVNYQLEKNAEEFINSNRGTYEGKKGVVRVSNFYLRNRQLFANFEADLKQHLLSFVGGRYVRLIRESSRLKADIQDMNINDLVGGYRQHGGSINDNTAALTDTMGMAGTVPTNTSVLIRPLIMKSNQSLGVPFGRFPPDVVKMLKKMEEKRQMAKAKVMIKDETKSDK